MKSLNHILLLSSIIIGLALSSCASDDEEIKGCTDSRAENYNPKATASDNSCTFPNEKFFGQYIGNFKCNGLLSTINVDTVQFEFAAPANANDVDKVTLSATVGGIPLSLEGTVNGNEVTFTDKRIDDIPFNNLNVSVLFSGKATINGNDITAEISASVGIASDTCTLTGKKQ